MLLWGTEALILISNALICFLVLLTSLNVFAETNALTEYIQKERTIPQWTLSSGEDGVFTLEFQSQVWREIPWKHRLTIVVPENIQVVPSGYLHIGGSNPRDGDLDYLKLIANRSGTIAAHLTQVPNQPLFGDLKEDALLAYTLRKYEETGEKSWPILFPMVKSAVVAMDVLQQFSKQKVNREITSFVIGGASKRGWTTWLVASQDNRIKAIIPMVFEMINMERQTELAQASYGAQSERIKDYTELGLVDRLSQPRMQELLKWIDPYSYLSTIKIPKLIVLGTNDPYWVIDSTKLYQDKLIGEYSIFEVPNGTHSAWSQLEARETVATWYSLVVADIERPYIFTHKDEVRITIKPSDPAASCSFYLAFSEDKDFRNDLFTGVDYNVNQCSLALTKPLSGYSAFLGEAEFKTPKGPLRLSTVPLVIH